MSFQFSIFLNLIRALFPKWSFFDQIAYGFELEFKIPGATRWEPLSFQQSRQLFSLFLNPHGNLALAQGNILEHFVQDIQQLQLKNPLIDSKDVQSLTTFKMLKSLLEVKLQEYELGSSTVQFKVVARSQDDVQDFYISDWIHVERS